jgi:hypothetical protein
MSWSNRFRNLFRTNKLDGEIDEELEFHVEARFRDNIRAGMPPAEARQDAVRRFGSRMRSMPIYWFGSKRCVRTFDTLFVLC